jgi:hypothetical protein
MAEKTPPMNTTTLILDQAVPLPHSAAYWNFSGQQHRPVDAGVCLTVGDSDS